MAYNPYQRGSGSRITVSSGKKSSSSRKSSSSSSSRTVVSGGKTYSYDFKSRQWKQTTGAPKTTRAPSTKYQGSKITVTPPPQVKAKAPQVSGKLTLVERERRVRERYGAKVEKFAPVFSEKQQKQYLSEVYAEVPSKYKKTGGISIKRRKDILRADKSLTPTKKAEMLHGALLVAPLLTPKQKADTLQKEFKYYRQHPGGAKEFAIGIGTKLGTMYDVGNEFTKKHLIAFPTKVARSVGITQKGIVSGVEGFAPFKASGMGEFAGGATKAVIREVREQPFGLGLTAAAFFVLPGAGMAAKSVGTRVVGAGATRAAGLVTKGAFVGLGTMYAGGKGYQIYKAPTMGKKGEIFGGAVLETGIALSAGYAGQRYFGGIFAPKAKPKTSVTAFRGRLTAQQKRLGFTVKQKGGPKITVRPREGHIITGTYITKTKIGKKVVPEFVSVEAPVTPLGKSTTWGRVSKMQTVGKLKAKIISPVKGSMSSKKLFVSEAKGIFTVGPKQPSGYRGSYFEGSYKTPTAKAGPSGVGKTMFSKSYDVSARGFSRNYLTIDSQRAIITKGPKGITIGTAPEKIIFSKQFGEAAVIKKGKILSRGAFGGIVESRVRPKLSKAGSEFYTIQPKKKTGIKFMYSKKEGGFVLGEKIRVPGMSRSKTPKGAPKEMPIFTPSAAKMGKTKSAYDITGRISGGRAAEQAMVGSLTQATFPQRFPGLGKLMPSRRISLGSASLSVPLLSLKGVSALGLKTRQKGVMLFKGVQEKAQKPMSTVMRTQLPIQRQRYGVVQIPTQRYSQISATKQVQKQRLSTTFAPPSMAYPFAGGPVTPPPPPMLFPPVGVGVQFGRGHRKTAIRGRRFKYQASLIAVTFGITAPKQPKISTGFGVRPVIKSKRKKRKK